MRNYFKKGLIIFVYLVSSCAQNIDKVNEDVTNKNTTEDWGTDSLFLERLNSKGLFPFNKDNKIGFKDKSGNIIVDAKYDIVPGVNDGTIFGLLFLLPAFDFLEENTLLVGIKNDSNKENLDETEFLRLFSGDYLFGLIDINGKELVEPSFNVIAHPDHYAESVPYYVGRLLGVYFPKQKKKNIFMNSNGEFFDLSIYNSATPIDYDLIRVEKNGKYGVVTKQGELKVPIIYDGVQVSSNLIINDKRLIEVCNGCRFINSEELCGSGDDVLDIFVNGNHGVLDESGNVIIPLSYESILTSNKVAFLNKGGKIILDGDCDFFVGGQWEKYDPITNNYSKTNYKAIVPLNSTLFAVNLEEQTSNDSSKGEWGLINEEGKEILPLKYSSINLDYEDTNKIIGKIGEIEEVYIWNGLVLNKVN
jgi:hypothetical protein